MAAISPVAYSYTLAGTAVAGNTFTGASGELSYGIEIALDPDATGPVYFRMDGTAAVGSVGAGRGIIYPGQIKFIPVGSVLNASVANVSVIGTGVISGIAY